MSVDFSEQEPFFDHRYLDVPSPATRQELEGLMTDFEERYGRTTETEHVSGILLNQEQTLGLVYSCKAKMTESGTQEPQSLELELSVGLIEPDESAEGLGSWRPVEITDIDEAQDALTTLLVSLKDDGLVGSDEYEWLSELCEQTAVHTRRGIEEGTEGVMHTAGPAVRGLLERSPYEVGRSVTLDARQTWTDGEYTWELGSARIAEGNEVFWRDYFDRGSPVSSLWITEGENPESRKLMYCYDLYRDHREDLILLSTPEWGDYEDAEGYNELVAQGVLRPTEGSMQEFVTNLRALVNPEAPDAGSVVDTQQ